MFSPPHLSTADSAPHMANPDISSSGSPATINATPSHVIEDPMAIFDLLSDPTKQLSDVETFVLSNPSCLMSINIGNGCTPLHEAARRGSSRLLRFFVDNGATLEARGNNGETAFLVACDVSCMLTFFWGRGWLGPGSGSSIYLLM
jgi:ankyrin repeat protein